MSDSTIRLSGPSLPPVSGTKAKQLIVFLHGVGSDGQDLISLAPIFAEHFPDAHFVSPNGAFPYDMAPFGYQWFSLRDRSPHLMREGVQRVAPIVSHFLDEQLDALGLDDSALGVIGFSQGTMTSLHVLPRRKQACAGFVGYSGAMLLPDTLQEECRSKPPTCLIHGEEDAVVPFGAMSIAEAALQHCDIPVESYARPMLGHGIDQEGIDIAIRFFKERFGLLRT